MVRKNLCAKETSQGFALAPPRVSLFARMSVLAPEVAGSGYEIIDGVENVLFLHDLRESLLLLLQSHGVPQPLSSDIQLRPQPRPA
jgi:hypothetical protein